MSQLGSIDIGRFGIWQNTLDQQPTDRVRDIVAEVEAQGWGCLWRPESTGRDSLITSALYLGATTRLRVATGITQTYARHPLTTMSAQRTLWEAFEGRFLLGLGVSHAPQVAGVRGLDYSRPYQHMVDYLTAMDAAPFTALEAPTRPPRVLAALGPKMLALSASAADGAHPYFTTPDHTAAAREVLGPDKLLAPEQMVVIDADADRARATARTHMQRYLELPNYTNNLRRLGFADDLVGVTDHLVDAIVAWGDVETVAARLHEHVAAGADHVCVQVLTDDPGTPPVDSWRLLAEALELTGA